MRRGLFPDIFPRLNRPEPAEDALRKWQENAA
jgi:hypothetical protein